MNEIKEAMVPRAPRHNQVRRRRMIRGNDPREVHKVEKTVVCVCDRFPLTCKAREHRQS